MITITLVFVALALFLAIRSKSWLLTIICFIAGLYMAGTGIGHGITDALNSISHNADNWMGSSGR